MTKSDGTYFFNGHYYPYSQVMIPINNRSFRFGDGIFESLRVIDGRAPLLQFHLNRMRKYAALLQLNLDRFFSDSEISQFVNGLLASNGIASGGRLRINIFRQSGEFYTPESNEISLLIEAEPLPTSQFDYNPKGLVVDMFSDYRKPLNLLSNAKTNSSLIYVMAGLFAREKGLDNCILQNDQFNVAEAMNANIFLAVNGVLYTPPVKDGCVDGVMRQVLIHLATSNGIKVYETTIKPNDLLRADELFLTNGLKGIQWVSAYRSKRYFNNTSAKLNQILNLHVKEQQSANL
ncbi:MAG: aminotransferase class IV [Bacteroidota bacterium]|jgi:branched-subunit amino acid aminotransferase/4-amino-4-deoxychorismate lyase